MPEKLELIDFQDINKRGINICHLNARSNKGKLDEIKWILSVSKIKILCITESWLNDTTKDHELHIPNFNIERSDRHLSKRGGGLLMYIHQSIIFTKIPEISRSDSQLEQIWISSNQPNGRKFIVGNVYRPPNESYKNGLDLLRTSLKAFNDKAEIYIFGDFNINMATTNNAATKDFNWLLHCHNMVQHIKSSTRVAESSRTIIDLIITTKSEKIQEVSTVLSTISDHYPVYINIKKPKTTIKKIKIKGRNYKNYTPEAFNNVLKTMDWEKVIKEKDPEISWKVLEVNLFSALDGPGLCQK